MYTEGSVIDGASFLPRHLADPSPLIFTGGGQKVRSLPRFSTPLAFQLPAFGNGAKYLKPKTSSRHEQRRWPYMSSPHLVGLQFGQLTPENQSGICAPLKIGQQKRATCQ